MINNRTNNKTSARPKIVRRPKFVFLSSPKDAKSPSQREEASRNAVLEGLGERVDRLKILLAKGSALEATAVIEDLAHLGSPDEDACDARMP